MKKFLFAKFLIFFLFLCGFTLSVSAGNNTTFEKGDIVANVGIGLRSFSNDQSLSMVLPPITVSFEYGILELFDGQGGIGVGGYAGYHLRKMNGSNSFNVGNLIIGPRGLFHYQFVKGLDTYAGLMFGYDVVSYSQKNANLAGSDFTGNVFIGARYYLTDNVGIFGELGSGPSFVELGVAFKF